MNKNDLNKNKKSCKCSPLINTLLLSIRLKIFSLCLRRIGMVWYGRNFFSILPGHKQFRSCLKSKDLETSNKLQT